ncbi:uncharacterized protein LOC133517765 isoform X1 [Cydia pomonella]|uniref:uncharacterized protein LOC133517765 isoform X1 n=1 Tax=Cydia pomonella TaxID=82600 RepID=UPI002ADD94CB|nr:uncharacterized protein LOC133517765 isoform X1 [Cydia pomonella]
MFTVWDNEVLGDWPLAVLILVIGSVVVLAVKRKFLEVMKWFWRFRSREKHDEKEGVAQAHAFRSKSFRKPQPCHWCHQPVAGQGSCCRVCKYVCHTSCENMVSLD